MVRVSPERSLGGRRGQLVLLAGVVLALALVPLVLAYLQLGYHEDVAAGTTTGPAGQAEATMDRAVHDAAREVPATYGWARRSEAVETVQTRLEPTVTAVEESGLRRGITRSVAYNQSRAREWAVENCPRGPARQFGRCVTEQGVVVQERRGQTHVLAVAVDIAVTTPDRTVRLSTTITHRAG